MTSECQKRKVAQRHLVYRGIFLFYIKRHLMSGNEFACSRSRCVRAFKAGVDIVMDDVSMLTKYAQSDWLIVSVRDVFIEIL